MRNVLWTDPKKFVADIGMLDQVVDVYNAIWCLW